MAAATVGIREEVADVGGHVGGRVDDVQRVVEDVEVVERRLLDVVQGIDLGQHGGQDAELVAERQRVDRVADAEDALQLRQLPLAGRRGRELRVAPGDGGRVGGDGELQLGGQPRQAQQTQRIVAEHAVADHAEHPLGDRVDAAVRVRHGAVGQRHRDGVGREVAPGQVVGQRRAVHLREVDHPPVVHHAPGTVALGERERGAARAPRVDAGRLAGIAGHDDVPVVEAAAEQVVADGAADDPALVADQRASLGRQVREAHAATSRVPRSGRWRRAHAIS